MKELRDFTFERIDIVFDRYFKQSLKSQTREKLGSGVRVSVKASTPISKNWRQFLRVDENKEELFYLLAKRIEIRQKSRIPLVGFPLSVYFIFSYFNLLRRETLQPNG